MAKRDISTDEAISMLHANIAAIAGATTSLTDKQAAQSPVPGEWSVNEILAHPRCCADLWTAAIEIMLCEDHPRIRAINPRHAIKSSPYPAMPFRQSFAAFQDQREQLLTTLESLGQAELDRSAEVYGAGAPLERTVAFYVQWLARHERSHLRELARVAEMARTQGISQD